jgi:hypothetical protein
MSQSISRGPDRQAVRRFRPELLPPARAFYEKQFGQLRRVFRGWARVRCIFHSPDADPSLAVNVEIGAFRCFSCGEHGGDLVAFVRLRDKCTFREACVRLGCWDGSLRIDATVILKAEEERVRRELERKAEAELERSYFAAEGWLYRIEEIYCESNTRLSELRQGAAEAFPGEIETHWNILALAQDEIREAEEDFVRLRCAWASAPHNEAARVWRDHRA